VKQLLPPPPFLRDIGEQLSLINKYYKEIKMAQRVEEKVLRNKSQLKALKQYSKKIESGTLTLIEFKKLSSHDRYEYLKRKSIEKRGDRGRCMGYYSCEECAKADIFETGGYISEGEGENEQ
jgi:hypothetical protein